MQQIHVDIREYDRFIVASPIYFMGVTAQVKAMIDRCQALWVIKYILKLPVGLNKDLPRKGAFISAGATEYGNLFTGSIVTMKSWYKTLDIEYTADILVPGVDSYDSLACQPATLAQAFSLGQQLAS
jgi:FMN-dependent NADH-azoreductase